MKEKTNKKTRTGIVIADVMDKTRVVEVQRTVRHPKYEKIMRKRKKYYAHDEKNESHVGDRVVLIESRPISKMKKWRILEILKK